MPTHHLRPAFEFWRVPGRKQLIHDGKRLVLVHTGPAVPALALGRVWKTAWPTHATAVVGPRTCRNAAKWLAPAAPTPAAVLELHTLQALDATQAGASLREIAEGLFGVDAVAADWHKDSALRARVRRLVRRGEALMRGGYRRLAQLPPPLQ